VGNRTVYTQTISGQTTTTNYIYDTANRLSSVNGQAYQWDANGNLLSDGTSTYAYDAANRLTSLTQGANTYGFAYNGLGDRVAQTVNSTPTRYTLDLNAGLTQVLADGTNTYLYGVNRIGEQQPGGFAYHLPDALGSVRQLTNASGAVTLAKGYQPYGTVLNSSGSGTSISGFTGEVTDNSGLVFLRARYLSTGTARFLSRDLWEGDADRPMSYNAWLYAYASPTLYTDASGHVPCANPWTSAGSPSIVCFERGADYSGPVGVNGELNFERDRQGIILRAIPRGQSDTAPQWADAERRVFERNALTVGEAFANVLYQAEFERLDCGGLSTGTGTSVAFPMKLSAREAFLKVFGGPMRFVRKAEKSLQYFTEHGYVPGTDDLATRINNYNTALRLALADARNPRPNEITAYTNDNTWGYTVAPREIWIFANVTVQDLTNPKYYKFITHEMGHAFNNRIGGKGANALSPGLYNNRLGLIENTNTEWWQFHVTDATDAESVRRSETFADMFLAWVYRGWVKTGQPGVVRAGQQRQIFMNDNMANWIVYASNLPPWGK
jgi:RHS repeat-associated protein